MCGRKEGQNFPMLSNASLCPGTDQLYDTFQMIFYRRKDVFEKIRHSSTLDLHLIGKRSSD